MRAHVAGCGSVLIGFTVGLGGLLAGCQSPVGGSSAFALNDAVERYAAAQSDRLAQQAAARRPPALARAWAVFDPGADSRRGMYSDGTTDAATAICLLGTYGADQPATASAPAATQPTVAATAAGAPAGYWRQDIWHQMGHEALDMGKHDFWRGFKTSFWDLENALVLTATMGASITIRETGVDDTIAGRAKGHRQLGDADEPIQILGNPGTHFAAAGVLWLGSALTKDMKEHEFSRALVNALAARGLRLGGGAIGIMVPEISTSQMLFAAYVGAKVSLNP